LFRFKYLGEPGDDGDLLGRLTGGMYTNYRIYLQRIIQSLLKHTEEEDFS